ncbi:glycerol-3-phosphate dehydrogenase [Paracoccaceae bacterium]|nr:glycerol-3-phosphate dehydrogenase [Paracoccaceae bacterium]
MNTTVSDLFIIGGGVNGCGVARDAAGRGLSVVVAEMNDLGSATSSSSTKLFHGGLRYLEFFEFRLVREALKEREVLLKAMPHISWPMRFILPLDKSQRFETSTPASKLLNTIFPFYKNRRPAWLIRVGLFLYDLMGGRTILPRTSRLDLSGAVEGRPLKKKYQKAFEYSDCWIEDSRLVVLNAKDAARLGAKIHVNTKVISANRENGLWRIETRNLVTGKREVHLSKVLINAGGPWVSNLLLNVLRINSSEKVRLVRGSHIVVRKMWSHEKSYFFQGDDGRIIFAIPYETDFTLIGTTDIDHPELDAKPKCTEFEKNYLINFANQYFESALKVEDIVWTYSGVRPLQDTSEGSATSVTRDYSIKVNWEHNAPLINVFGGKITTYRKLAESVMHKVGLYFPQIPGPWTAEAHLPGGNFPVNGLADLINDLRKDYPFLSQKWAERLVKGYGREARVMLGSVRNEDELGINFGASLTQKEVEWLIKEEFATSAEDILWRRTKLGLRLSDIQVKTLQEWMYNQKLVT